MSITTDLSFRVNLDENLPVSPCEQQLMAGDQQAHRFIINCYRNHYRECVDLTGAHVHGYFVYNGKETILLDGETAGHTATLTLPGSCYAQAGGYSLVIKLRLGQAVHTVLWCQGKVLPTSTELVIDPGQVLPNLDELLAMIDRMEATTAEAEKVFNMTAEAYTLPAGSAATAEYTSGKLTLGIPRGLDSDTALPPGYKPFQMLAIGPDGKPRWEDRTHYDYSGGGTVLPLTDLQLVGGYCTFKEPFENIPKAGLPYHVTYYGYDYNLVAKEWVEEGKTCVTLGNQKDLGGTEWTQEPFVFVFYPEKDPTFGTYGYFSCLATNKETMAVSIQGAGELKKIDPKFLPEGAGGGLPTGGEPYKQLVTDGKGNAVWEDRPCYMDMDVEILPETIVETDPEQEGIAYILAPLTQFPVAGETYNIVYDGQVYTCEAIGMDETGDGAYDAIIMGNTPVTDSAESNIPFMMALVANMEMVNNMGGMCGMIQVYDGKTSFSLSVGQGTIKKISPVLLPPMPEHKHEPMKLYISSEEVPSERSEHQVYRDEDCTDPLTTDDLEEIYRGREFEVYVYDPGWEIHVPCKPMCYCNFLHHLSMPDPYIGVVLTFAYNRAPRTALCFLDFQEV